MNTPAHVVVNLALLSGGANRRFAGPILAGSLLPDLPMFVFYAWQKLGRGASEGWIWGTGYFLPSWQACFDLFNSIPLALAGLLLAWGAGLPGARLFWAAVLLHVLGDLPLHREDAHGHFFPLSSWRFESPVSYWDPAHHGRWAALAETIALLAGCVALGRRFRRPRTRALLGVLAGIQVTAWTFFYAG